MTIDLTSCLLRLIRWWLPGISLLIFAAAGATVARSQSGEAGEYEVKAAFLYNFAKYVKWPATPAPASNSAFVIGIVGTDPFGAILDRTMQGKAVQGKPIVVQRYAKPDDVGACDMLFIGASESRNLAKLLAAVDKAPILTVGDMPEFAQRGGMINLVVDDNRVHFEVNVEAAERARLTPSSQLLRLAKIVSDSRASR